DNKSELQKIVTYVFNFMLFYSLVSATVIIYFSDYILYLISPDLSDAYYILVTLIVSHSIQSCFTITGTVLTLSGNNQVHLKNLVISIVFFIVALLVLTNIYGALGAALSYLVFIIIKSCLSTMSLKKCLNVTIAKV
ncbi:hypothetical protein L4C45_23650, partial [Vibrio splendidus]